ncbi:MATE efflux family protein [Isosphaera pallida ATCC 43644]|uniref:MATE efflux family protein n=1 Tax=Isosphaera pallida (strain ATCC 43644 / DSM 9630 / IS1B) TaxID=575540 RepID=E8R2W7_ISOPI|nr:MATE efflux family protein [Isosphaera pallida ATCC 43644]
MTSDHPLPPPRRPNLLGLKRRPARTDSWLSELGSVWKLALPVAASELAWATMNLVDLLVLGRVGVKAIAAASLGSTLHFMTIIVGMGLLAGMDPMVSQAHGAGERRDARQTLFHGGWLAIAMTAPMMLIVWAVSHLLEPWGIEPELAEATRSYLLGLNFSTLPLMLYVAWRRYLQGVGIVRSVMVVMIAANVINAALDVWLVFGGLGLPALGVAGAGWATFGSRVFMSIGLLVCIRLYHRETGPIDSALAGRPTAWMEGLVWGVLEWSRVARLFRLGLPTAGQFLLEMGAFGTATLMAGTLGEMPLAAHQLAMNLSSLTFMVPLGIGAAGAVRVGHNLGAGRPGQARRAGWTAMTLGVVFMFGAAVAFLLLPRTLMSAYTSDPNLIELAAALLFLAALFQLFDGVQVIATGLMRGAGETQIPMFVNGVAHWMIGLPLGWWLAFRQGLNVTGLWIGLTLGLVVTGTALLVFWTHLAGRLETVKLAIDPPSTEPADTKRPVESTPKPNDAPTTFPPSQHPSEDSRAPAALPSGPVRV